MNKIHRTRSGVETLIIKPCPSCKGAVQVVYPNSAKCIECKRKWKFKGNYTEWDCALQWNKTVDDINRKIAATAEIKIGGTTTSRNFHQEGRQDLAKGLVDKMKETILSGEWS